MSALFALAASLSWGFSDIFGALQSKQSRVLHVLLLSCVAAALAATLVVVVSGEPHPPWASLGPAVGAGASAVLAVGCIYRAIAIGPAIVAVPIAAAGTIIPIVYGQFRGEPLTLITLLVCVLTLFSATVAAGAAELESLTPESRTQLKRSIPVAALAALGAGLFFIFTKVGSESAPLWTVLVCRLTALGLVLFVLLLANWFAKRSAGRAERRGAPAPAPLRRLGEMSLVGLLISAAAGLTDFLADLCYAVATTGGNIGTVTVIASMYPAVTVILAVVFWRERLRPIQLLGAVLTMAGIAFLSLS